MGLKILFNLDLLFHILGLTKIPEKYKEKAKFAMQ